MIDEIHEIVRWLHERRNRIDRAMNDIIVDSSKFDRYENAVDELGTAIADCKQAMKHFQAAHSDTIIWEIDA